MSKQFDQLEEAINQKNKQDWQGQQGLQDEEDCCRAEEGLTGS